MIVLSTIGESSTSRPVREHKRKEIRPRDQNEEITCRTMKQRNPCHKSPTVGSNVGSGEGMYDGSCLRGENGRGVSRRFMIMRATSCGMLTMAVLPGITLAPSWTPPT